FGHPQRTRAARAAFGADGSFLVPSSGRTAMPGRFLEQNQIGPFFEVLQRNYLNVRASASAVLIEADIIAAHHSAKLLCLVERSAQRPQQPFARHLQDVEAGPAGGWFQIRARIATKL